MSVVSGRTGGCGQRWEEGCVGVVSEAGGCGQRWEEGFMCTMNLRLFFCQSYDLVRTGLFRFQLVSSCFEYIWRNS